MIYREVELNKLMWACLSELRGMYTSEQSVRILLVVVSIYYLNGFEQNNSKKFEQNWVQEENSIVDKLVNKIKQLEFHNEDLKGIFTGLIDSFLQFTSISTMRTLRIVIERLSSFQFIDQKEIVQLINLLAFKFSNDEGTHETPDVITKLSLGLVDFKHIQSFADFCSGISSVALEISRRLQAPEEAGSMSYYGEEINVSACLISKLLMIVNRVPNTTIINKDVLDIVSKEGEQQTFDFILSDSPFGVKWNNESARNDPRYKYGIPPRSSADWAFYQNALYHLNEKGKAIVVGTKGTLVRSTEVNIRKAIIEDDLIEAIITLPESLYSKTSISTELIIFNKGKPKSRLGKILFIDASEYSYKINRNQHSITEDGIIKIIDAYWNGTEEERFCRFIDVEKIRHYKYSLNSKEYLDFDILKNSFHQTVKLGEIAEIRRGVQLSKEEYEELSITATHYLLNIKDIENGRITYDEESRITYKKPDWLDKFAIQPMDILITSKGSTIKFAIVEEPYKKAFISGNLSIIRVNPKRYNVYVLYEFLQSEVGRRMIDGLQTGTTIKLINPSKLEQLEIPSFTIELMNEVGERLKHNKQEYEEIIKETEERFAIQKHVLLEKLGFHNP
ncbi:N-6 DNA methylase [Paenibacillus terrae]